MEQSSVMASIGDEPVVVGGDGRADSPGHCAKFGSYSIMDLQRNKVLDIQLVQVIISV
jgi:solute carrier family 8 (sodium/calcium exchanger)